MSLSLAFLASQARMAYQSVFLWWLRDITTGIYWQ